MTAASQIIYLFVLKSYSKPPSLEEAHYKMNGAYLSDPMIGEQLHLAWNKVPPSLEFFDTNETSSKMV